jgi:hypothetical protein
MTPNFATAVEKIIDPLLVYLYHSLERMSRSDQGVFLVPLSSDLSADFRSAIGSSGEVSAHDSGLGKADREKPEGFSLPDQTRRQGASPTEAIA